jgi:AcrR family transcriptional regulator
MSGMTDTSITRRRRTPSQARSRETVDAICAAASSIIEAEGITALTTNAVASRAGVSITSVYAYFPDKWAIVHELFGRFERLRGDALVELADDLRTAPEWRPVMDTVWDTMARFRAEVPGGMALRRALHSSPELAELDRQGSERSARTFATLMLARRPGLDPDAAHRAAWAATLVAGTLLDDVVRDGTIDHLALAEGKRLIKTYLALYLDEGP